MENFLQTNEMDDATLALVGNAIKEVMYRREKEKLVFENFGEIKTVSKNGGKKILFIVRKNGKQITATTREGLVDKLYSMIEVETEKNITVEQLFEMYNQKRMEDTTISSRTADFDRPNWVRFFGDSKLKEIKVVDVTTPAILIEYKRIVGRGNVTKKDFGKATSLLNGMFNLALEMEIVQYNVARTTLPLTKKFTFKAAPDHSNDVWTKDERDTLVAYINTLPQTRYTLAIRLAACFPLRVGELRALKWDDYVEIDGKKKMIINHEIVKERIGEKNSCDVDKPFPKGGKDSGCRKVQVSIEAAKILEELRAINGDKKYILNGEGSAKFSISTNKINEHLKRYCEGAGVPYYSSHKFRFYGATQMYARGIALSTIQRYLGHSTLQMTLHYLRPDVEDIDEDLINDIF